MLYLKCNKYTHLRTLCAGSPQPAAGRICADRKVMGYIMRKRLMLIIMSFVMVFSAAVMPVSAAVTLDDIIFELQTLGIMEGNEDGDFQLEKPVTRAEFAAIASRMMNMGSLAESYGGRQVFDDVPADHWANGYIVMLSNMGIINGMGDGTFAPDEYLSYENISKMLVCCLGYSVQAEGMGGYPTGYTALASQLGLLDGVSTSYQFTREATANMVYNALYVNIMTEEYTSAGTNYVVSDTTFRDGFSTSVNGNVERLEGVVTATVDAYMYNAVPGMGSDQVQIENLLYYTSDTKAAQYIGQKVVYYVDTDNSNRVISMRVSEDNEIYTVDADDLRSVGTSSVSYYSSSNRTQTLDLSDGIVLLKNNRPVSWSPSELENLDGGELTFINNSGDEDSDIDVIIYKSYVSGVVESVNASQNMIYFNSSTLVNGRTYIDVDPENDDIRAVLYKADGTPASIEDVSEDDLISVCVSSDGTFMEGIISDVYEEGIISSVSDDELTINGTTYPVESSSVTDSISIDREVRVYINFKGEAAYIKQITTSTNYGYVAEIYPDESGSGYWGRIIIPDKLQERTEEEENEDGGEATVVSLIVAKNKELSDIVFAETVNVTDENAAGSAARAQRLDSARAASTLEGQVIRYTLNEDGQIMSATILAPAKGGDRKVYNSYERTFGKGNGSDSQGGGFGVDLETNTICVPDTSLLDGSKPSKDDYLAEVEMNNGRTYEVKCYDLNESRHVVDLIVVTATMRGGTLGDLNSSSDVAFVTKVSDIIDEETGDDSIMVTMLAEGQEREYSVTETYRYSDTFERPKCGSVIAYSLDSSNRIENMEIIKSYDVMPSFGETTVTSINDIRSTIFVGYALSADYNYVSSTLNRWVTRFNISPSLDEESDSYCEIYRNNAPPVFIFNSAAKTAEYGDVRSIAVGSDIISTIKTDNKIRAVVVIR